MSLRGVAAEAFLQAGGLAALRKVARRASAKSLSHLVTLLRDGRWREKHVPGKTETCAPRGPARFFPKRNLVLGDTTKDQRES